MSKSIVYFDVDDTRIRTAGTKRPPIPAVIERVRTLHAAGITLYLWSSGGEAYARKTAGELGLSHCFAGFLPAARIHRRITAPSNVVGGV